MIPVAFLRAVAAVMPGKVTAGRSSIMAQFAPRLAGEFDADQLTPEVADKVAARIGEAPPAWPELLDAIRAFAGPKPERKRAASAPVTWPPPQNRDEELEDLAWWRDRFRRWHDERPEIELAQLHAALRVLTGRTERQNGRHHPRPTIVFECQQRIAVLEATGVEPAVLQAFNARPNLRHVAHDPAHGPTVTTRPAPPAPERDAARYVSGSDLAELRRAAGIAAPEFAE